MRVVRSGLPLVVVVIAAGWAGACSTASGDDEVLVAPADSGSAETTGDADPESGLPTGPFDDFPAAPIFDETGTPPPKDAATLFGAPGSGDAAGPCLAEPEIGSLFPRNWLRPRFRFAPPSGHNLFEIRLHTTAEKNDLVVYTTQTTWLLPSDLWKQLSSKVLDTPITVTIRSAAWDAASGKLTSGPSVGSTGDIAIAPADAAGTIVYWVLPSGSVATSHLKGFDVGDESVTDVLEPSKIGSQCFGCHTSTPDGKYVALSSSDTAGDGSSPSWIEVRSLSDPSAFPPFLTDPAKALLARKDQHGVSFSKAHWTAGDRVMLSHLPIAGKREIVWTDLEAKSTDEGVGWGVLPRGGDGNAAGGASFSHDGKSVVYFSAPAIGAGVIDGDGQSDLMIVPFGDRKGGTATPLAKAPAWSSYYPVFSADDALVAFNRVPRGQTSYNDANAEVFVVPAAGGTPTRLVANDPPACLGEKSPGLTNSWPKWSPTATTTDGKTYYWLTFSSTRGGGHPQLYVAPVVVVGSTVRTFPALYLWNQPAEEHNHTPAWDVFSLPIK